MPTDMDKRRLLIGNGFSIACCPTIFTYGSILEEADFSNLSSYSRTVFDKLETQDFELVIKALQEASTIASHYSSIDLNLIQTLNSDSAGLKDQLAQTIASRHPNHPSEIPDEKYIACRQFLSRFKGIYSLNYDLLLYWTMMHEVIDGPIVLSDDGFRRGNLGDCGYVMWDAVGAPQQNVHYMHGALHLFDRGSEFVKFTWRDTNIRLMDQIRAALDDGRFPRIVAEGTSQAKLASIMHCAYLHRALRSLQSVTGELVIYGMAMTQNDDHVLDAIARGRLTRLYVGIYGDPTSKWNIELMQRAEALVLRRQQYKAGSRLIVSFFDSASAKVWG